MYTGYCLFASSPCKLAGTTARLCPSRARCQEPHYLRFMLPDAIHALNQSCENGLQRLHRAHSTSAQLLSTRAVSRSAALTQSSEKKRGGLIPADSTSDSLRTSRKPPPISPCISFTLGQAETMFACTDAALRHGLLSYIPSCTKVLHNIQPWITIVR